MEDTYILSYCWKWWLYYGKLAQVCSAFSCKVGEICAYDSNFGDYRCRPLDVDEDCPTCPSCDCVDENDCPSCHNCISNSCVNACTSSQICCESDVTPGTYECFTGDCCNDNDCAAEFYCENYNCVEGSRDPCEVECNNYYDVLTCSEIGTIPHSTYFAFGKIDFSGGWCTYVAPNNDNFAPSNIWESACSIDSCVGGQVYLDSYTYLCPSLSETITIYIPHRFVDTDGNSKGTLESSFDDPNSVNYTCDEIMSLRTRDHNVSGEFCNNIDQFGEQYRPIVNRIT